MINTFKQELNEKHDGVIAMEYMIVLVLTASMMFTSYAILNPIITNLSSRVIATIANTGGN